MNQSQGACSVHPNGCPDGSHRPSNQNVELRFVICGHETPISVDLNSPLYFVIPTILEKTGNTARDPAEWEIRDVRGVLLSTRHTFVQHMIQAGDLIFLSPQVGTGGSSDETTADDEDWQPIETAPKDHFILLFCPRDHSRWLAMWQSDDRWYGVDDCGLTRDSVAHRETITHWMYLPAHPRPPEEPSGNNGNTT